MADLSDAGKEFLAGLIGNAEPAAELPATPEGDVPPVAEVDPVAPVETPPAALPDQIATPVTPEAPVSVPTFDASALESSMGNILAEIQALKETAAPATAPGENTPVESILSDDEFMERFAEDPVAAVTDLANSIADKKVSDQMMEFTEKMQPFIQESEKIAFQNVVTETLAEFVSNEEYADADKYFPEMAKIIKEQNLPQDDVSTYENLYNKLSRADLKSQMASQDAAPKSLEDYLADENEVSKIVADPKIKEAVISGYLQEIANGGAPQVISSGGSVQPAATPPTQFKSVKEAGAAFGKSLQ